MSWGYWGIVSGLLVLLTVSFFCIDLLYDMRQKFPRRGKTGAPGETTTTSSSDSKHVA
jgi:hypothetical protein